MDDTKEKTNLTIDPNIKAEIKSLLNPWESLSSLVEKLLFDEIEKRKKNGLKQ